MFFVVLESVISPKVPTSKALAPHSDPYRVLRPTSRRPEESSKDRVEHPGLDTELFERLKRGHKLTMLIRLRRRTCWHGEDIVSTYSKNNPMAMTRPMPPVSPTEHWTLYFGESITYDILISNATGPVLWVIVPATTKTSTNSHTRPPWDRGGLGSIVFSTMEEKISTFMELHVNLFDLASDGDSNVSFYNNILAFLYQRQKDGKIKELHIEFDWWDALLTAMIEGCGNGNGYLETDCTRLRASFVDSHIALRADFYEPSLRASFPGHIRYTLSTHRRPLVQFTTQDPSPWAREESLSSSLTLGQLEQAQRYPDGKFESSRDSEEPCSGR
ncbi:hypothetical protein F5878DRAFT_666671 [Lentinula raphanica]|uniref:Uncharacterized protein n=1 Tax=Lentinula raphanica TaxID=153919 RepID=A0AA38U506_9AGAR|nr:hypothetical protein F5878DRAFT_666671 [Lentinula raphanica]